MLTARNLSGGPILSTMCTFVDSPKADPFSLKQPGCLPPVGVAVSGERTGQPVLCRVAGNRGEARRSSDDKQAACRRVTVQPKPWVGITTQNAWYVASSAQFCGNSSSMRSVGVQSRRIGMSVR